MLKQNSLGETPEVVDTDTDRADNAEVKSGMIENSSGLYRCIERVVFISVSVLVSHIMYQNPQRNFW